MSYEKINFKNREVEKPLTFKKHVNDDGTITLEPKPGTIVEPGTPLLADHFNHMDDGIYKAHEEIDNLKLSGIERNKELVANLNSKKVSATTNDSLKTNIAKVKDIKLGSGNAVASDVLQGKTFSSSSGTDLTGTMPNHGSLSKTITTQGGSQKLSKGYYEGGEVKAQFNNLTSNNIKKGVNVGGIVGNLSKEFKRVEIEVKWKQYIESYYYETFYRDRPSELDGWIVVAMKTWFSLGASFNDSTWNNGEVSTTKSLQTSVTRPGDESILFTLWNDRTSNGMRMQCKYPDGRSIGVDKIVCYCVSK